MTKACPTNTNQVQQTPVQKPMGSPIRGKIRAFYDELRSISGVVTTKQEFEAKLSESFTTKVAGISSLPILTKYGQLENILASWFGMRSFLWDAVTLAKTQAGEVQQLLIDKARLASNMVEYMATYKSLPTIRRLYGELQTALPNIDKPTLQALVHDYVVIGQYPKLTNIYDSPIVRQQLRLRYNQFNRRLRELGVTDDKLKLLDELAGEISANLDNTRMLVGKYGLDVKILQNGGYFPLKATDEAKRFFEKANEAAFTTSSKQVFDTAGVLNDSRTSAIPAVLDLDKTAKVLGITVNDLINKITVPGEISRYLNDRFTPDELERLFNNGTLIQIPALSDELTDFFSKALDLPLANMGEAIVLDPVKALQSYNNQLKNAVENAAMVQTALEDGVRQGWVLDEFAVKELPNAKDYVKIGSNKLFAELFADNKLRDAIADSYIHRTVADQLDALWKVNTSFEQLGAIGAGLQAFMKYTGFIKKGVLLATGGLPYISRVFTQNAISLNAATGSRGMFHYGQGLTDVARVIKAKSIDTLSNAKEYDKFADGAKSLRELYETTFLKRSTSFVAGFGEKVQGTAWDKLTSFNPESMRRFLKMQELYHQKYGSPVTGVIGDYASLLAEMGNTAFQAAYEQLAGANQFLDYAARWTAVRTLADNPQYAGRQQWQNLDELLSYTDEYFNINDNSGIVGKVAGQMFIPFASFALVAPGSALRHAIRHPQRYARMMLLYSQAQHANGERFTDEELKPWQRDSYPLFIGKTTDGNTFAVNPGTVDFYLDTLSWARENFEKVARVSGVKAGSAAELAQTQLNPERELWNSMSDFFDKFYVSQPIKAILNIDPQTKQPFTEGEQDTLLGFGMSKRTRTALTGVFPVLRGLDRLLPASVSGAPAVLDPRDPTGTTVKKDAIPSWTGAVPTSGGTRQKEQPTDVVTWVANNALGLSLQEIDPEANLISSYKDFDVRIGEINTVLNKVNKTLVTQPNYPNRERLQEQQLRLLQVKGALEYNKLLVEVLARKRGYSSPRAVEAIRTQINKIGDQPKQEAILQYLKQQYQQ